MKRRQWIGLTAGWAAAVSAEESGVAAPGRLRVVSYNIHHGEGVDGKLDLDRIAVVLGALQPDLVALQEVDNRCRRTAGVEQASALGAKLSMQSFFSKAMDYGGGGYGTALLSRRPPASTRAIALPAAGGEPRAAAMASFGEGAGAFHFVALHLDHEEEVRRKTQIETLIRALPPDGAVLVAGDFNARPDEALRLMPGFSLAGGPNGIGPGFPSGNPGMAIDHFFLRALPVPGGRIVEGRVIDERVASDHRPITGWWER